MRPLRAIARDLTVAPLVAAHVAVTITGGVLVIGGQFVVAAALVGVVFVAPWVLGMLAEGAALAVRSLVVGDGWGGAA